MAAGQRPDRGDYLDHSIELFNGAIARDRHFARAHAGLGEAYWRKYQSTRDERWSILARDCISEALRLDSNDPSVSLSVAAVYRGMGRMEEAIEELNSVVTLQPDSDEARRQLGQALIDTGRRPEGLVQLREAIRLRPNFWGHRYTLGVAHYTVGEYDDALVSFRRVTELQPNSAWGYHMLGTTYHAKDDTAKAVVSYQRAIELGNAKAWANLGLIHLEENRPGEAVRCFTEALRREPGSAVRHHNLGDAYWMLGRRSQARAEFRRAAALGRAQLSVNPRDVPTLATTAVVEAKLGRHDDARRHIAGALELAPESADAWHGQATTAVLAGRNDEALRAIERAMTHGYSRKRIAADVWLAPLRGMVSSQSASR